VTAPTPIDPNVIRFKPDGTLPRGEIQRLAFLHFQGAYDDASAGGTVPAEARQLGYALRRRTGLGDLLDIAYVATSPSNGCLLDKYIERVNPAAAFWDVVRSPRGTFLQPNGDSVALGTLAVRAHLNGIIRPVRLTLPQAIQMSDEFPKFGPTDDFASALYIEKAGFNALLNANGLTRRRDLAVLSSQGFSVDAARAMLVNFVTDHGLNCYVAHDFDPSGIGIVATIQREVPAAVDLGLRWRDIEEFIASGDISWMAENFGHGFSKSRNPIDPHLTLEAYGATEDEIDFLVSGTDPSTGEFIGQRVELNALVGQDFIDWLDERLVEGGIEKAIPTDAIIESAWRQSYAIQKLNAYLDESWHEYVEAAEAYDLSVPQLLSEVTLALDVEGGTSETWRTVVSEKAEEAADEDEPEEDQ
jgi:hypothetical protein